MVQLGSTPLSDRQLTTSANTQEDQDVMPDFGEHVDNGIFEQILEMDDDDKREFSKSLVTNFFDQAEETFVKIEELL